MGVVRREGHWRLEKLDSGEYEITYQNQTEMRVLTPDYRSDPMESPMFDTVPVREVGSYQEAEGLFEEYANESKASNVSTMDMTTGTFEENELVEGEDLDLPPAGLAVVLFTVGGIILWINGFGISSTMLTVAIGFIGASLVIPAYGYLLYSRDGWSEAREFLFTVSDDGQAETEQESVEKTPPAPEKLKNELIFDRANQHCEWCDNRVNTPEVHHITPRKDGGPNKPGNLIVLCPNCHAQADRGGIPKTKLRAKLKRQPAVDIE